MKKIITFFNEKGGTGKTTFTVLFASWLRYDQHKEATVMDYDFPSYHICHMRQIDERLCVPENKIFYRLCQESLSPYPIIQVPGRGEYTQQELIAMADEMRQRKESGSGYLVLDFPGRYRPNDPVFAFASMGLIDLVVFPITSDTQSRVSALNVFATMHRPQFKKMSGKPDGQDCLFVWNNVTQSELRAKDIRYNAYNKALESIGAAIAKTQMKDIIVARRDPDNPLGFIRSTMCYPKMNVKRYCPYIEDLFKEIKDKLDQPPTNEFVDLS